MKQIFAVVLILLAAFLVAMPAAQAQAPSSVQQSGQRLDVATNVGHSHTSAATITITPPGNQYVYLTGIDISNCAGGTAVTAAAPTYITTTGITGAPQYQVGSGVTAGLCTTTAAAAVTTVPLKSSTPGSNVTVVLPTFATNQTVSVNVYYYTGP